MFGACRILKYIFFSNNDCRTWSPRGQTDLSPLQLAQALAHLGRDAEPSRLLALGPGTIASDEVIRFVEHLLRFIPGPIFLFWDGGNPHRSRHTRAALEGYRERLRAYRLPAYAPELNPDEWLWAWLKQHALRGLCPPDLAVLKQSIRQAIRRLRRHPQIIRSFFHACPLSF